MQIRKLFLSLLCVFGAFSLLAQDHFETLRVGSTTYSNVSILNRTKVDLFISHSRGMENLKVRNLDDSLRQQLGYEVEGNHGQGVGVRLQEVELDPRVKEAQEKLARDFEGLMQEQGLSLRGKVNWAVAGGALAGFLLVYLFYCYCCHLICLKAGAPSRLMIWVPGLQIFPLFRAAGMSRWLVLGLMTPQIFGAGAALIMPETLDPAQGPTVLLLLVGGLSLLIPLIIGIVWCVKICKARHKNGLLALLLLFPLTSFFAFLYLAFSSDEEEGAIDNPEFVTFS